MDFFSDYMRMVQLLMSMIIVVLVFGLTVNSFILAKAKKNLSEKHVYFYQGILGVGGIFLIIGQLVTTYRLFGTPITSRFVFLTIGNVILIYVFVWFIRRDRLVYKIIKERFKLK